VLYYRLIENKDYKDIAVLLNESEENLRKKFERTKKKIKRLNPDLYEKYKEIFCDDVSGQTYDDAENKDSKMQRQNFLYKDESTFDFLKEEMSVQVVDSEDLDKNILMDNY